MRIRGLPLVILIAVFLCRAPGGAEAGWMDFFSKKMQSVQSTGLDETKIGQGLKEALSIGIDRAAASAGREGGYLDNPAIRIRFPEKLALAEKGLRKIGMGSQIDDFERSVNRAAEKAAPAAKGILLDSLFAMSIEDARKVLGGGPTAATDYFREKTWESLTRALRPQMESAMSRFGAAQKYNQLIQAYEKIPLASKPEVVGADAYATQKALEGLFFLVGEQEKKIRQDPSARVTDLLQKVFSSPSS